MVPKSSKVPYQQEANKHKSPRIRVMRIPGERSDEPTSALEATLKDVVHPDTLIRIQSLSSVMDRRNPAFGRKTSLPSEMEREIPNCGASASMNTINECESINTRILSIEKGWNAQDEDRL